MLKKIFCLTLVLLVAPSIWAQETDLNAKGVDTSVDYQQLYMQSKAAKIPWDDRNLKLTAQDLALLPAADFEDSQRIPLFYRVIMRQRVPELRREGKGQYPRSAPERFKLEFGGLMVNGKWVDGESKRGSDVELGDEVNVSGAVEGAETAIAINPVNPNLAVAGANGPGGQYHYFSTDGGLTWTAAQGANPIASSCCDPTMAWSPDGSLAYGVTLGGAGGVWFYRSSDNGASWTRTATISSDGGDDKEYMHVDHYNCDNNPNCGNIYITWHRGNDIRVSRSTDNGDSFTTFVQPDGEAAIGSDITSDANGDVYHFWPNTSLGRIFYAKSTNAGASFGSRQLVVDTNAHFDYPIPAMDARRAFLYVTATTDLTGGTYHNRMYVAFNDLENTSTDENTPSNNHSKIRVGRSIDGGSSWQFSTPHSTSDINTVDRFHPWMEVDGNGYLHVVYYDTRNDSSRRNPDMYHSISKDGGETWETPVRLTSVSSQYFNDGFQWGDYNGLAIVGNEVRPIWTDNRPGGSGIRAYSRDMMVNAQQGGDFTIGAQGSTTQSACIGQTTTAIPIQVTASGGFTSPVTFAFNPALPQNFTSIIENNPVTPDGQVSVSIVVSQNATPGAYAFRLEASGGQLVRDLTINLTVVAGIESVRGLWRNAGAYDPDFDPDSNGVINVLDLVAFANCQAE